MTTTTARTSAGGRAAHSHFLEGDQRSALLALNDAITEHGSPCRRDPALWDSYLGQDAYNARAICRDECPVLDACLRYRSTGPAIVGVLAGHIHAGGPSDWKYPAEVRDAVLEAYVAGARFVDAGRPHGVSGTTVQRWVKDVGLLRDPVVHGTVRGYSDHKCECEHCLAAYRAYNAAYDARREQRASGAS